MSRPEEIFIQNLNERIEAAEAAEQNLRPAERAVRTKRSRDPMEPIVDQLTGEVFFTEIAAAALIPPGISLGTLRSWRKPGFITVHKIGRKVLISKREIIRIIEESFGADKRQPRFLRTGRKSF